MPPRIALERLPEQLQLIDAVGLAYPTQLADLAAALSHGLPCLIECAKEVVPFLGFELRRRLQTQGMHCFYLDGRPAPEERPTPLPLGELGRMVVQLREAVRGPVDKRIFLLPHLDLLTSGPAGLTAEGREVVALLHENPLLVWGGFRSSALPVPRILEELALYRMQILGVERGRLGHLVARSEGRKFGREVDIGALYRQVSGVNAVRLRRLLSTLDREDMPVDPAAALAELRRLTLAGGLAVPEETFDDVGGYAPLKQRLRDDILSVLARADKAGSDAERARWEGLLPRGVIFAGPPGVGKRLLARALANAVGAALLETSGAELKSRYVGGSEENLRQLFWKARQSAPALVLFRDLAAFAPPPGRPTGPVEPSMLQQLLQELDALPPDELVLVAGGARAPADLDPVLLRAGRFELVLEVRPPNADDRRDILEHTSHRYGLAFTPEALDLAVELTTKDSNAVPWSGERLQALARALARQRLRSGRADETSPDDVRAALAAFPEMVRSIPDLLEQSGPDQAGKEGTPRADS